MKFEIKYANAAITQENEMTFDFTFDSRSKTAMEVIHEITSVINAIKVILFIVAAQALKIKHKTAIMRTVSRYFSQPPRLNRIGINSAAQTTPSSRHFRINISVASIKILS